MSIRIKSPTFSPSDSCLAKDDQLLTLPIGEDLAYEAEFHFIPTNYQTF